MRLIDADAVERYISKGLNGLKHRSKAFGHDAVRILTHIHHMPTIDAVPVVRCKDCTQWDEQEQECKNWYGFMADDFCSFGERTVEQ